MLLQCDYRKKKLLMAFLCIKRKVEDIQMALSKIQKCIYLFHIVFIKQIRTEIDLDEIDD